VRVQAVRCHVRWLSGRGTVCAQEVARWVIGESGGQVTGQGVRWPGVHPASGGQAQQRSGMSVGPGTRVSGGQVAGKQAESGELRWSGQVSGGQAGSGIAGQATR
jgi:hypothetical protein